jgi:lipoprotein-releasing system permease protein
VVQRPPQRIRSIDQWQKCCGRCAACRRSPSRRPVAAGGALAVRGEASRSITLTGIEPGDLFPHRQAAGQHRRRQPRLTSEDIVIGTDLAASSA